MSATLPGTAASLPPVVTLLESYGSGASYIGRRVATALGLPFHEQAFSSEEIEDAAERRESEGVLSRFFGTVGGSYAGLEGPSVAMAQRDDYELVLENTRIVQAEANQGGVILGRNGRTDPGEPARGAARQTRRTARPARRTGREGERNPRDTDRYDPVVNTGTMDLDTCVDIIVAASRIKAQPTSAASAPAEVS